MLRELAEVVTSCLFVYLLVRLFVIKISEKVRVPILMKFGKDVTNQKIEKLLALERSRSKFKFKTEIRSNLE